MRNVSLQGGMSCKLCWTDLRGKRMEQRLNRMKDEEGRIMEGGRKLSVGRSSEDDVVPDTAIGNVGGCELGMCKEVRWEKVVEVLKCLRRGKAPCPTEF